MDTPNMIGVKMRIARARAQLTQDQVAEHLHVDRTAVVKWESQRVGQFVNPERDRLVEFARLTRTPLAWFVDETDSQIPELLPDDGLTHLSTGRTPRVSIAAHAREFWNGVIHSLKERRSDLWSKTIYSPPLPDWQRPLSPDILTDRSAVALLALPRPYYYTYAQAFANLVAFERSTIRTYRLAILDWVVEPGDVELAKGDEALLPQFMAVRDKTAQLAERLRVGYLPVRCRDEAVEYLLQIL